MGNFGFGSSIFGDTGTIVQDTGKHFTNCTSVKEYAYEEDKNYRYRPQMEDSKQFLHS